MATNVEKANKAAENLAGATRDSCQTVMDHAVGLQERNVRFAQGVVDGSIKELRHQAEGNRSMTQELAERVEKQRHAYQTLVEQSFDDLHGPRLRATLLLQGGPAGRWEHRQVGQQPPKKEKGWAFGFAPFLCLAGCVTGQ